MSCVATDKATCTLLHSRHCKWLIRKQIPMWREVSMKERESRKGGNATVGHSGREIEKLRKKRERSIEMPGARILPRSNQKQISTRI